MKKLFIFLLLAIPFLSRSQNKTAAFNNSEYTFTGNFEESLKKVNLESKTGPVHLYVHFKKIPNQVEIERMKSSGIKFLEYIPQNTYLVSITADFDIQNLRKYGVDDIKEPDFEHKVGRRIYDGNFPDWAYSDDGSLIKVIIQAYPNIAEQKFSNELGLMGLEGSLDFPFFMTEVAYPDIKKLASNEMVKFVEVGPAPDIPEDREGRNLNRANLVQTIIPSNRNYRGDGVALLVRDDGKVSAHIDFKGRKTNNSQGNSGNHGDGVAGVMAGAGNLYPPFVGAAPGSEIFVTDYSPNIGSNATRDYHLNEGVMITNSSYSNGCNAGYTSITQAADKQMHDYPTLMHVFSAGNSGHNNCGYGAGSGWGNITGGHKMGKNVITVANTLETGILVSSSSRGPANDGRIKPDITAHGSGQGSTNQNNDYFSFGGTSAAAPTIAGNLALLYEAYRSLNGGTDPDNALIKACALNSAYDAGNRGPDFQFGWGIMHTDRALEILENNQYVSAQISNGQNDQFSITVPQNVSELRVMIYWTDPAASPSASKALVNDLDLRLTKGLFTTKRPWVLDHTPNASKLNSPATRGIDRLNNMEQVSIDNPSAGSTYTVKIDGHSIPVGPQKYYVVWSFIKDELKLTYPKGGESFKPGAKELLHWDAVGDHGTFKLEYTLDNGINWNILKTNHAGSKRVFYWDIPDTVTSEVKVRISRGNEVSVSPGSATIIGIPELNINPICDEDVALEWNEIRGADSYIIYQLGAKYMDSIAVTTDTVFNITGLPTTSTHWFAVQAVTIDGGRGRRSYAKQFVQSGDTICEKPSFLVEKFVNCIDDTTERAKIYILNGTPPYIYHWSNGETSSTLSGVSSGTYSVTVKDDDGDSLVKSITIDDYALFTINLDDTPPSVGGGTNGSITCIPIGGKSPYQYSWSNGASSSVVSNLSQDWYSVTSLDSYGCLTADSVHLKDSVGSCTDVSLKFTADDINCTWKIIRTSTNEELIHVKGWEVGYQPGQFYSEQFCLPPGCYTLIIKNADFTLSHPDTSFSYHVQSGWGFRNFAFCIKGSALNVDTHTEVICNELGKGHAQAIATFGTPPYNYLWSNGATSDQINNVVSGNYSVTVWDANDTVVKSAVVPSYAPLQNSFSYTSPIFGSGGSIASHVSSGTFPYQYLWSTGGQSASISNLAPGWYNLTVFDDQGCTSKDSLFLQDSAVSCEPFMFTLTLDKYPAETSWEIVDTQGNGILSGGPYGPAQAQTTIRDSICLFTGCYILRVKDSYGDGLCCQYGNGSFLLENLSGVVASGGSFGHEDTIHFCVQIAPSGPYVTVQSSINCGVQDQGSAEVIINSGTPPYNYLWSNGSTGQQIVNVASGNYDVTVTDANGTTVESVTVDGYTPLTNNFSYVSPIQGTGGSITSHLGGGTSPYQYSWNIGAQTSTISNLPPGWYQLTSTDDQGCSLQDSIELVDSVLSSCNPVTMTITFDQYPAETSWEITDDLGTLVMSGGGYGPSDAGTKLQIKGCLADGCYKLKVIDSYGDGICCNYGNGSYTLDNQGAVLATGGSFTFDDVTSFCLPNKQDTCNGKEIFISEYLEGFSYNKAIEIYNPTLDTIDMNKVSLVNYKNGSNTATSSVTMSGTLLPYETYVIVHSRANSSLESKADFITNNLRHNGDDAIVLARNNIKVDIFGRQGHDPGTGWRDANGIVRTRNGSLRRYAY
ncbi:MAG: S8 family serine peptidase, partial [Flavobacteriales bacterium]|nr:S8 family serine peptidase [Flavobacteriales bacterium]